VLITGESGTGKEVVARTTHAFSPRASKPFVTVNCAAIPETLLESELFGHRKGAFTGATYSRKGSFELAHGGTIFLDEIGEMKVDMQAKILRVLDERKVKRVGAEETIGIDVRVIAASNKNLEEEMRSGNFREDLFYRLNVIQIAIPPLREHKEDISILAHYFLKVYQEEMKKKVLAAVEQKYGELENPSRQKFGAEAAQQIFQAVHRSYDVPPPDGESLKTVEKRVRSFIKDLLKKMKKERINVAISAHGNSMRPFRRYFEKLSVAEMLQLENPWDEYFEYIVSVGE